MKYMCVLKATEIVYPSRIIGFTSDIYIGFCGFCVAQLGSFLCCAMFVCFVCFRPVSYVPNGASVSGLSILHCPSVFPNSYLVIHYDIDLPITFTYIYKY